MAVLLIISRQALSYQAQPQTIPAMHMVGVLMKGATVIIYNVHRLSSMDTLFRVILHRAL